MDVRPPPSPICSRPEALEMAALSDHYTVFLMWDGNRGEEEPPPLVFRLHHGAPEVVREVLLERGWEEYNEQEQKAGDWNLYWRASTFRSSDYENLLPWQRLNHHPKTSSITRKDYLARHLKRMRGAHGSALYNFSPTVFILPSDYTRFLAEYTRHRLIKGGGSSVYWICKPVGLSRGRGIFIFEDIKDLVYDSPVIVQRYISSPLLISGYKFDLRIYVCVKSFVPLTIYMHQEGLVRFATEKYDLSSLDNLFAHLTNTSINKFGPSYTSDKESVGQGCKWTMSKFRCFLHSQGVNAFPLWQKISNIVTLTLLTIAPSILSSPNCIELFGFDILVDSKFKPWLLEVNYSPALTLDCQVDVTVKKGLIGDLIDLMNYRSNDCLRASGYQRQMHKRPPCCLSSQTPELVLPKYSRSQTRKRQNCSQSSSQTLAKTPREPTTQSSHAQKLPLPEVLCQHQSHKRSHSQLSLYNLLVDRQRHLPSFDLKRIHAERRCVNNTDVGRTEKGRTARGVNPIRDPHSRSPINEPLRPALASWPTVNGALLVSEVTRCCNDDRPKMDTPEDSNVSSVTSDSPRPRHSCLRQRHPPVDGAVVKAGPCKLPEINRRRPLLPPWGSTSRTQASRDGTPPRRVGDFILTFPFNKATLKASRDKLDVKTAIQEVHRLTGQLVTGRQTRSETKRRQLEEEVREERAVGEEDFHSLFWGPKDPPLLRDCYLSS